VYVPAISSITVIVLFGMIVSAHITNRVVDVYIQNKPIENRTCVIIDAGHGGVDPGAIAGEIYEKNINLSIALKLKGFFDQNGFRTKMLRTEDISLHDEDAKTIHQKKVSDLKNRVKIANSEENAIYISIHQNTFGESKYFGAQVFYGINEKSKNLAGFIQTTIKENLQENNNRKIKNGKNLYILKNIEIPAVMVECGFMSNKEDLKNLTDEIYQNNFSEVLFNGILKYIEDVEIHVGET
jgi:N-acetylmuramoyl-L-alanine amidase